MISIRAVIAKQQTKKQTRKGKEKKRQKREQGNKMSSKRQRRANLGKGWNAKVDRNRQTKEKAKLKQNRPAMTDCLEIADSEQANA